MRESFEITTPRMAGACVVRSLIGSLPRGIQRKESCASSLQSKFLQYEVHVLIKQKARLLSVPECGRGSEDPPI